MEGKKSRTLGEKCQAVSEVYGQVLMVVVTIILAASLVYPNIPESPPRANLFIETRNFSQNETTSAQNSTTPTQNSTTSGDFLIEASSGFGGSISPTGKIYVPAGGNKIFSMIPDENYKVLDVLVDGNSVGPVSTYTFNNVSSSHSIQASFTVDFDVVNNNTVVPKGNFTVNAVILGSAFIREASVYGQRTMVKFPVTCSLKLGDCTYTPWGDYTNPSKGNINDGKSPRFWSSNNTSKASTSVKVEACSWEYNKRDKILTVSTSTHPSNLKVLKNGDSVPDIPGFADQDSIEYFIMDYIDNDSIKLKENEAIYLFELGNTNLNSAGADFQDLVILVSVNGADTPQSGAISSDIVHPDETLDETQDETPNKTSNGTVLKFVIEHRGGDTINFNSTDETKVILQKGDDQRNLNFTGLGVFKVGDSSTFDLKYDDEETRKPFFFSQGDRLSIKIVDVRSKSLIYSGSITVK